MKKIIEKDFNNHFQLNNLYIVIFLFLVALFVVLNDRYFNIPQQINNPQPIEYLDNSNIDPKENIPKDIVEKFKKITPAENKLYTVVNNNKPFLINVNKNQSYKRFSRLDNLKRVGPVDSVINFEDLPNKKRESILHIHPSGWKQTKYDFISNGGCLYNRCHLLAFQLSGENDNPLNLMTGTQSFNNKGMLPFENLAKDYIKSSKKSLRYRITPIFNENDLVAKGVLMEAISLDDNGEALMFNVFIYNTQPNVEIDYKNGVSVQKQLLNTYIKEF